MRIGKISFIDSSQVYGRLYDTAEPIIVFFTTLEDYKDGDIVYYEITNLNPITGFKSGVILSLIENNNSTENN